MLSDKVLDICANCLSTFRKWLPTMRCLDNFRTKSVPHASRCVRVATFFGSFGRCYKYVLLYMCTNSNVNIYLISIFVAIRPIFRSTILILVRIWVVSRVGQESFGQERLGAGQVGEGLSTWKYQFSYDH